MYKHVIGTINMICLVMCYVYYVDYITRYLVDTREDSRKNAILPYPYRIRH